MSGEQMSGTGIIRDQMGDGRVVLGIHSLRSSWVADVRKVGLLRPDSAAFRFGGDFGCESAERHRTLLMAVFFGISMSTLRQWVDDPPTSYERWYETRRHRLPSILGIRMEDQWWGQGDRRYVCRLRDHYGVTAPYSKVSESGSVDPGSLLVEQVDVTLDDIAAAEERLVRDGRWEGPWDDEPFYRKMLGGGGPRPARTNGGCGALRAAPGGERHGAAVLRLPLLCAEIATRLTARIPAEWRSLT
ncbi:hypothetical protein [Streptomyces sp. bgisy029]|uniref:hypothetical protein n=1 Tax=Streptomyces sp. bgisy029 TaxID=3413771 RepID=UPI003D7107D4